MGRADQTIDLLNNIIGREIGKQNPNANNKELARKAVEEFYKNGLWTAIETENGITIQKTTINEEEYNKAIEEINRKNEKGLNFN